MDVRGVFPSPPEVTGGSYADKQNEIVKWLLGFRPLSRWLEFLTIVVPENEYTDIAFPSPPEVTGGSYPYDDKAEITLVKFPSPRKLNVRNLKLIYG